MKRSFPFVSFLILSSFLLLSACSHPEGYRSPKRVTIPERIMSQPTSILLEKPIFTIDAGGHKAVTRYLKFTRDGKYLVSASHDKTARVWDVATGEVVRVLRGQIGEGREGSIFAAALSPDDRFLAVGGEFRGHKSKTTFIRLLDFQTGEVTALLKGHRDTIFSLAFSADGKQLVSGSMDRTARIWDVSSGRSLHVLKGHENHIRAVSFSPDGTRVVTGSHDRTLRLWNVQRGSLVKTLKGHQKKVQCVAFTPDGRYLLSGSDDKTIRLWDGSTGAFIKVLSRHDEPVRSLSVSPDGTKVLTGHLFESKTKPENFRSSNVLSIPSGEHVTSFTKHWPKVLATAISPDGSTAATGGGAGMAIYLWNISTGRVKQEMKGKGKAVWSVGFAEDGRSIAWGKTWKPGSVFSRGPLEQVFHIKGRGNTYTLSLGKELKSDKGYQRGIKSVGPWSIRRIKNHPKDLKVMKYGSVMHKITRTKKHLSFTLTPNGKAVISGGKGGHLYSYDSRTGKKVHAFVGHTAGVMAVAASPDSRFLVSGSADQTVRLWEVATGRLLLTIFHGTDNEWVAWTPEGFFDASPGGTKYIGYHLNRGEDKAADYVRVGQVYDQFYRPDLIAMKLEGGHEAEIRAELEKVDIEKILAGGVPPAVEFLSPETGKEIKERDIYLRIQLTDKGGGIGRIVYRINGVTIGAEDDRRGLKMVGGKVRSARSVIVKKLITLQPGDNRIVVTAFNERNEIESSPASISLYLRDVISERPSLYVLTIGINTYRDRALKLTYSVPDARALAQEMNLRGKGLFRKIGVEVVTDKEATLEGIESAFRKLSQEVKANDLFVLYIAGHGTTLDGKYHFIPWELVYQNEDSVRKNGLTQEGIQNLLAMIPALKSVVLLDTCMSGSFATPAASRGLAEKSSLDKLMRATGRATIAASSEAQVALEGYKGHGVFTYALLQGLKGDADTKGNRNGEISINELAEYVSEEVPRITYRKWGYEQFPMQNLYGRSFPIGLVK